MSSIAYNLTRKMGWMSRHLRKIDEVAEIRDWVSAMREINGLLKEVVIKDCKDNWRPWCKGEQRGKSESMIDHKQSTRPNMMSDQGSRPPRVEVQGDDIEMIDPKAAVMKMLREANYQQGKIKPLPPRVQVDEEDTEMKQPSVTATVNKATGQEETGKKRKRMADGDQSCGIKKDQVK